MGLAVLPGRLYEEIEEVKHYVRGENTEVKSYHKEWAEKLKANFNQTLDIDQYVQQSVGDKFTRVLENAGVFKLTEEGESQFRAFVEAFNN